MSDQKKKARDRDSNFSSNEINFLLECMRQGTPPLINTIENKKTDGQSVSQKRAVWKKTVDLFASNPNCRKQTSAQLEAKWRGLTNQTKTKVSEFRKAQQSTDGLPPPMALSNMHQQIYDLIPAHFERIENEFDDDAPTFKTEHQQSQKLESNKTNDPNSPMDSMDTESTAVTSQKSSKMGPKLKKSQTEQSESSSNAIIDQKYLMDLRKCQMTVEHKLKMKLIQEEHDLKIGLYECKKAIIQQQNQINELKVVTLNEEIKASREKASHYRMLQMFQSSSEGRNTISAPPSTDECTICRFV